MGILSKIFDAACKALSFIYRWLLKPVHEFLCRHEMPLWLTLVLFIATAVGTYRLSPQLNQTFEKQRIVAGYVEKNLDAFNHLSRDLISDISILSHQLKQGRVPDTSLRMGISSKITELQWRAIELDIIFENSEAASIIENYKKSLDELRTAVEQANAKKDTQNITLKIIGFTDSSVKVISVLAEKAGLKVREGDL